MAILFDLYCPHHGQRRYHGLRDGTGNWPLYCLNCTKLGLQTQLRAVGIDGQPLTMEALELTPPCHRKALWYELKLLVEQRLKRERRRRAS